MRSWRDEDLDPFPATCSDPEVIAPLDKLKGIIGAGGGGVQLLQPVVNFDGESMYIMLKRVEDKRRKRT